MNQIAFLRAGSIGRFSWPCTLVAICEGIDVYFDPAFALPAYNVPPTVVYCGRHCRALTECAVESYFASHCVASVAADSSKVHGGWYATIFLATGRCCFHLPSVSNKANPKHVSRFGIASVKSK